MRRQVGEAQQAKALGSRRHQLGNPLCPPFGSSARRPAAKHDRRRRAAVESGVERIESWQAVVNSAQGLRRRAARGDAIEGDVDEQGDPGLLAGLTQALDQVRRRSDGSERGNRATMV